MPLDCRKNTPKTRNFPGEHAPPADPPSGGGGVPSAPCPPLLNIFRRLWVWSTFNLTPPINYLPKFVWTSRLCVIGCRRRAAKIPSRPMSGAVWIGLLQHTCTVSKDTLTYITTPWFVFSFFFEVTLSAKICMRFQHVQFTERPLHHRGGGLELFSSRFFSLDVKAGFFFTHRLKPDFLFTKNLKVRFLK